MDRRSCIPSLKERASANRHIRAGEVSHIHKHNKERDDSRSLDFKHLLIASGLRDLAAARAGEPYFGRCRSSSEVRCSGDKVFLEAVPMFTPHPGK